MSLRSRFTKAVDWAFFNNGNKVDYTRLRIVDGTPLHSTGLPRLMHDFRTAVVIGAAGLAGLASDGDLAISGYVGLGALVGAFIDELLVRLPIKETFADKCFRKKQRAEDSTNISDALNASESRVFALLRAIQFGPYSIYGISEFLKSQDGIHSFCSCFNLPVAVDGIVKVYQFNKVGKGEWTIEDTPPPEKKPEKQPLDFSLWDPAPGAV